MLNQNLQTQAVIAAKNGDWKTAKELNEAIIKDNPQDIAAFNRLGVALMHLKKTTQAKKAFTQALKIDPKNKIAKKNLERIKLKLSFDPKITSSNLFVEEPGKTAIIKLCRTTQNQTLNQLTAGDECELKVKKRYISIEKDGKYLGALPDDISFRLIKLMRTGNQYTCYVQTVKNNLCCVYLKEVKRSKRNLNMQSFPVGDKAGFKEVEVKEIKDKYQEKIPFEVLEFEQEDENEKQVSVTASTVIT